MGNSLPTISVVMPVYNEIKTIDEIICRVLNKEYVTELIIVDDYSTDGTREKLKGYGGKERIKVFYHEINRGKGAALRTGFTNVTGEIIIIQDADLEYDHEDYDALLKPIVDCKADVVFGSRFLGGSTQGAILLALSGK